MVTTKPCENKEELNNMDDNRKKLLELMEDLSFPLTPEEAEEKVKGLTDEEVTDLVSVYSDVVNYEEALEDYVRENNPEEYKRLVDARDAEIKKKDKEYSYELEKAQEEEDIELDSVDIKTEREIEEIVKEQEAGVELLEGIQEDVDTALKTTSAQDTPGNTHAGIN